MLEDFFAKSSQLSCPLIVYALLLSLIHGGSSAINNVDSSQKFWFEMRFLAMIYYVR